ncbi:hypothetical protein LCY76_09440 [Fictibacillus sp. KIGAM418]|uniref:Uncharacterized protein n=1 Tax=Fictibacillus marinisediminis TaxID=2878389 RepID=A0A9X1XAW1_9BACL|nr:hypothetical protein [Fictibacillus marinisediminis]MCK6256816.1 hypothetical protein [Fictibacillus marinisediminis]
MLRNSFLALITEKLNNFTFSQNDFDIDISESYHSVHVKITYRYIEDFYFSFTLKKNPGEEISLDRCPGIVVKNESKNVKTRGTLVEDITSWLRAMEEEMSYTPFAREFTKTKERFTVMEEKFNEIPDEYFSKEEGEYLKEKLENLEFDFEQKLREEMANKVNLENEIEVMKKDLEQLKSQVELLTKRGWIKSFGTKMYTWGTRYPKTTAFLAAMGLQLLPEEIKQFIPKDELINAILPEATTETPKLVETVKEEVTK